MTPTRPFLKWAGGKARLADAYRPYFDPPLSELRRTGGTWHEPFVGGGALFFEWLPKRAVLADVNPHLIDTYVALRDHLPALAERLGELEQAHDDDAYYAHRDRFNQLRGQLPLVERAALFIYFNRTGFNGLWRMNPRGELNVPVGSYASPSVLLLDRLTACSRALSRPGVELSCTDFASVEARARPGDLVYFDPPYAPLSFTSKFVSYAPDGFTAGDQARLRDVAARLVDSGVRVRVSNSSAPLVRELYGREPFLTVEVQARRFVNRDAAGRGPVTELLILGEPRAGG